MAENKEGIQGYTRDMLQGDVREVADELQGKIAGFFQERGVENAGMLNQSLRQGTLSVGEIAPVRKDIQMLQQILRTGEVPEQLLEKKRMKDAERIFGDDFLGPETVQRAFGVELAPESVPDVPFTKEEMERAKELGQMLILRTDRASDETPLTMQKMHELLQPKFDAEGKGKVLYNTDWYNNEDFYTSDPPQTRWALVSKDVVPGSTNKNYLDQTQTIADHIKNDVFQGVPLPSEYAEAVEEFQREKAGIASIITSDWETAAEKLAKLKLNLLTRRTPAEVMYDLLMKDQNNNERLLQGNYDWTISRSSGGDLVRVGLFDRDGASVNGWDPDIQDSDLGVVVSRSRIL